MLERILELHAHGWFPIPIPAATKIPDMSRWQKLRLSREELPTYFSNGQNVGLLLGEPSGGLIDIDLDSPKAIQIADNFLPPTDMESGRASSARSHRWYRSRPVPKTMRFEDPTLRGVRGVRATIVELRSTGSQTLVPPSRHPTGERYEWHKTLNPAEVSAKDLMICVKKLAACAIVAQYWQEGNRHELALSLCGVLLRSGWSVNDVEHFVVAAARAADDPEVHDRRRAVRDTCERLSSGRPATGLTRLSELLPKDVATAIKKWLNLRFVSTAASDVERAEGETERRIVKRSAATLLVGVASEAQLFHSPEGEGFARTQINDHFENWPLRSKAFRRFLSRKFFEEFKSVPNSQAMQDALAVIEGRAQFDAPEERLHTRIARLNETIYIDLANERWGVVEVTRGGWRAIDDSPVFFRRSVGMLPLPSPIPRESINSLRSFVNVGSDEDWVLLNAWLIGAFSPEGPYPVLVLHGDQGSAKSTTARVLRSLVDPNTAALRSEPRDCLDLMIAARNGWVISLDNLSRLPVWLSDALCRLSTGGGFGTREFYTNADEVLFEAQRPIIVNGIEELATRGDLLDRAIMIDLPSIPELSRRSESEFWNSFHQQRPLLFGALLTAVAEALRNLTNVKLPRQPRLLDFATWAAAAGPALGFRNDQFIYAYVDNRTAANSLALEASSVAGPLITMVERVGRWSGTATELLSQLNATSDEGTRRQSSWPTLGNSLSNKLRTIAPNLRAAGIEINFDRIGKKRTKIISLERATKTSSASSAGG
jgi:hypothetical protein